jgi:four helix bundle protein
MKHEQSRIYLTSRELIADAAVVIGKLPPGFGYLADQLRRASSSVLLNFAEGSRHSSLKERRRFFTMSAGSAAEVSAIADVAQGFGAIAELERTALKDRCNHVCAMLKLYR